MSSSDSDRALWDLLRYATPLVIGYLLVKRGTDWSQVLTMKESGGIPAGICLGVVALVGLVIIFRCCKQESSS